MTPSNQIFDDKRMAYGGFRTIVDLAIKGTGHRAKAKKK
jgi:hypothetical protein